MFETILKSFVVGTFESSGCWVAMGWKGVSDEMGGVTSGKVLAFGGVEV